MKQNPSKLFESGRTVSVGYAATALLKSANVGCRSSSLLLLLFFFFFLLFLFLVGTVLSQFPAFWCTPMLLKHFVPVLYGTGSWLFSSHDLNGSTDHDLVTQILVASDSRVKYVQLEPTITTACTTQTSPNYALSYMSFEIVTGQKTPKPIESGTRASFPV
eukprot:4376355-Amphidinium_carterae.1